MRIRRSDPKFRILNKIHIADMRLTDRSEAKFIIIYLTIQQKMKFSPFKLSPLRNYSFCGFLCQKMCIAQFGNVGIKTLFLRGMANANI